MLTRFVRTQLVIFTVVSLLAGALMILRYVQAPTLLGIGRITVTMDLPDAGGLYRFANVTYRGVQIGKVVDVDVDRDGATAVLSLDTSPPIPANLRAEVRSVSAVGEQYVDLRPRTQSPPYLHDGSVIASSDTTIPQRVGPMMEQLSGLINGIPKDKLVALLDETFKGFNGAGSDLQSLIDSSSKLTGDLNGISDRTTQLINDAAPVLDAQSSSADSLRVWSDSLAGVTTQVVTDDPQIRTLLDTGPAAAQEVSRLFAQLKPTLPVLLANLTTLEQVAVTYRPGIQQLLVLLPPTTAFYQGENGTQNYTGLPVGDFRISVDDPPACTVGFLPPSQWRSPAETTTADTPDGLYCKLPQDSPIAVRGARNYPCMGVPGKSAPTVQECNSDKPFQPLAIRQHATGPAPLDPNLIAQGIPPDTRVNPDENIYGPLEGTPMPGGPPPPPAGGPPPVAPSGFAGGEPSSAPSVAIAHYDPATGRYATPDGQVFRQADLSSAPGEKDWRSLILGGGQ